MIGLTPDGPRGPRRVAAPGVAQLAALAGVPVLPCAARTSHRIGLNTWDRMGIPLPFGRGVVVCEPAITVPRDAWREALPAIKAAMDRASDRADQSARADDFGDGNQLRLGGGDNTGRSRVAPLAALSGVARQGGPRSARRTTRDRGAAQALRPSDMAARRECR